MELRDDYKEWEAWWAKHKDDPEAPPEEPKTPKFRIKKPEGF